MRVRVRVRVHEAGGRRVDGHVVRRVVEELGARVPLDVVAVVVAPAQLHVEPVPRVRD